MYNPTCVWVWGWWGGLRMRMYASVCAYVCIFVCIFV